MEQKKLEEAKRILQDQINEEFEQQIGAARYERTERRRDERNGSRARSYEILGGRIEELKIPRARELNIRFTVFDMWERVQPRVVGEILTAYLLGKSAAAGSVIVEAFGQSRFSLTYLQRLVKRFEKRLKGWKERKIKKHWRYLFLDGMAVKVYDTYLKDKVVIFAYGMDDDNRAKLLG